MSTAKAEYKSDIALLAKEIADRNTEAAKRQTEALDRMVNRSWIQMGLMMAYVTALIAAVPIVIIVYERLTAGG